MAEIYAIRLYPHHITESSYESSNTINLRRRMPPNMSDEEDDDELLMAAAGQWAASAPDDSGEDDSSPKTKKKSKQSKKSKKQKKEKKRDKPKEGSDTSAAKVVEQAPVNTEQNTTREVFSLHLTKVPYEATQTDIRCAFGEKGCDVTSVRLVYDHNSSSGERHFRGVAFVDLADEASFQKGLELHGTKFLGNRHKVNVRPTKSKGELSEIVRKTQEKVAVLIARSKEKAREERASNPEAYDAKREAKKGTRKRKRGGGNAESNDGETTPTTKSKKTGGEGGSPKRKTNNNDGNKSTPTKEQGEPKTKRNKPKSDVKFTKKQRAKKAAVINLLKRKKMK